jgi:hypothetical protein
MKTTSIRSLAVNAALARLNVVVLGSLLMATFVALVLPWAAGKYATVGSFTDRVELTVRDVSMAIRQQKRFDTRSASTVVSYGIVEYDEVARRGGVDPSKASGNLPVGIDPSLLGSALRSIKRSGVPVTVVDLLLDKLTLPELLWAAKVDLENDQHAIVVPLRQSEKSVAAPEKKELVRMSADKKTQCLNDPLHPLVELPDLKLIPQDIRLYLGHAELRFLGGDNVVRGTCLFRSYYVNQSPVETKVILPSIALLAEALLSQRQAVANTLNLDAPLFSATLCLARKLASPLGISTQVKDGADIAFKKFIEACFSNHPDIDVKAMLETPIWLDFRRGSCGADCSFKFKDLTSSEKKGDEISMDKPLPVGGVVFVGRKDLFASDRVYTTIGNTSHGVDVQVESYVTIHDAQSMETFLSSNVGQTTSNLKHHKWVWALTWAVVLGTVWAIKEGLVTFSSLWLKGKFPSGKSHWYWAIGRQLGKALLNTIFVSLGAACAIALAFSAVMVETYRIISPFDSSSFQFVSILLISFLIEGVLVLSSLAENASHAIVHGCFTVYYAVKKRIGGIALKLW